MQLLAVFFMKATPTRINVDTCIQHHSLAPFCRSLSCMFSFVFRYCIPGNGAISAVHGRRSVALPILQGRRIQHVSQNVSPTTSGVVLKTHHAVGQRLKCVYEALTPEELYGPPKTLA